MTTTITTPFESIEDILLCPITLEPFIDPVVAEDGHTYERGAILQWIQNHHNTSPITRQTLKSTELRPNHLIKSLIDKQKTRGDCENETKFTNENECWYEGQMMNGFRHGHGTCTEQLKEYPQQTIQYSGDWKFNQKHGQGTLYNTFLCYNYTGQFKSNEMSGYGIMLCDNGDRFAGEFLHSKKNGYGEFETSSSSSGLKKYVGEYRNDQRCGKGHAFFQNGDEYIGEWKDDRMNGYGTYLHANENMKKDNGLFEDDVLVRKNWCNVS